ncbi:HNH endonuclease [Bacillus cereus]
MDEKLMYKQIDEYEYPINGEQPERKFLGNRNEKKCIFCGRNSDKVSFKKEAHVIPAALGNKSLFNWDECDECNEKIFSVHENELLNYLQLERILVRGKPRKGSPKYKPAKANSFITSTPGTNVVTISLDEEESVFEILEEENNILKLKCNNMPPYSLSGVCKALVHMAWSVLPEEKRSNFPYIYDWVNNNIEILPLYLDVAFIPGGGIANVILEIWESNCKESSNYPLVFRLIYGHKVLSFYLPKSADVSDPPNALQHLNQMPSDALVECTQWKIKSDQRQQPSDCTFTMIYREKE